MSVIKNLDEVRRNKRARKRLNQEKEAIELEILILQKRLEVIQGFLYGTIEAPVEWHEKPPMASDEIKNLYAEMETYRKHLVPLAFKAKGNSRNDWW